MKDILEIYRQHKIMPFLARHQLRVAAVGKMIASSIPGVDVEGVVTVCLLHDMGNIIKSDLSYFPEAIEPEGIEYWTGVKNEYVQQYGNDEHIATLEICRKLGLDETRLGYLNAIGFSRSVTTLESGSIEKMICLYADQRVGPHGVLSLDGRLADGRKRYAEKKGYEKTPEKFDIPAAALKEVERKIFEKSLLTPEDISDKSIQDIYDDLQTFDIIR